MDLIFPPKDLEKNTGAQTKFPRFFFCEKFVLAVQNTPIFPPKDLEKIQAPKIRMRRFFFFFNFQRYILFNVLLLRKIK